MLEGMVTFMCSPYDDNDNEDDSWWWGWSSIKSIRTTPHICHLLKHITINVYRAAGVQNMLPRTHSEATRATDKNRNAPAFYCQPRPTGRVAGYVWLATCAHCCYCADSCCRHPAGSVVDPLCCRMLQPHSRNRDATRIPTAPSTNMPMVHYVSTSQNY